MGLKRTPLKRNSPLKKGNSKLKSGGRIKVKPKTEEQKEKERLLREADDALYLEIWSERPHICESCGKGLGNTINRCFMEHVLEKGIERYAHLRHHKENIRLVCLCCHGLKTNGFPTERYQLIIDEVKRKFDNGEL